MNNEKRNKHMTLDDRIEIQECLNKGMTFKAIAQRIEKENNGVKRGKTTWESSRKRIYQNR